MRKIAVRVGEHVNATVEATWDGHGHSIMCDIKYIPANPPKIPTLSEILDQQLNITEHNYILNGGFFSMALDLQKRIVDWSIYTNPDRWIRGERRFEVAVSATLEIDVEFEEDRRVSIEEPTQFYEPVRGTFYLSWGEVSTWYAISPTLAIGVATDNTLAQIRLDGLHIESENRQVEGLWSRLRRRFGF